MMMAAELRLEPGSSVTSENTEVVEAVRARYRPERIKTLFVGESAPCSGAFFYIGDTAMLHNMRRAVELALGESGNFLESFKAYGWYLDDLASAGLAVSCSTDWGGLRQVAARILHSILIH